MASSPSALLRDAGERAAEIATVVIEGRIDGVRLQIDHDVDRPFVERKGIALAAIHLARPTLELVANVRFADFLRGRDSDPRVRKIVRGEEENGKTGEKFAAVLVDVQKLATLREPRFLRK